MGWPGRGAGWFQPSLKSYNSMRRRSQAFRLLERGQLDVARSRTSPKAKVRALLFAGCAALLLGACSTSISQHGALLEDRHITQVTAGMTQDQVRQVLGSPSTVAAAGRGNAYYYISSKMAQTAFYKPKEIDRRVVAVYFSQMGLVDRVANYGMQDGRVVDFVSRRTPSANTNDETIIKQLFRNLGQNKVFGG